jgi:hypothetical protein
VVLKRIKQLLKRSRKPYQPPEVEVKRQSSLQDDYDQTMMAISFAEAGAPEQALEVMRQRGLRKILVVAQGDAFTEPVMEYATLLAERMGYELIALNIGTSASDKVSSAYQQHMQEEFQRRAAAAVAVLQEHRSHPCGEVWRCRQGRGRHQSGIPTGGTDDHRLPGPRGRGDCQSEPAGVQSQNSSIR